MGESLVSVGILVAILMVAVIILLWVWRSDKPNVP